MKQKFVIITYLSGRIGINEERYLHKGNPRRGRTGVSYSMKTPQLKCARKFNSREDAERVLKDFTPDIFDGSEKIIEVTN
jgi:hypothetical protein